MIRFMQKTTSTILIFIFSLSLFTGAAFGLADCKSKCCCQMAKMKHNQVSPAKHAAQGFKERTFLTASDCCSGAMNTPCEFTEGTAQSLPETVPANIRAEVRDLSDIVLTAIIHPIKGPQPKFYARGPDPWLKTKSLPIYLQHHIFLC